jgi:signal transduction histidine kinase
MTMEVLAGLALGGVVVAVVSIALLRRRAIGPLRALRAWVERLTEDSGDHRPPDQGIREVRALGEAIDRAWEQTRRRIDLIDHERGTRDAILGALGEGVVLLDRDGAVRYRNQRVDRLLGTRVTGEPMDLPQDLRDLVDRTPTAISAPAPVVVITTTDDRMLQATTAPIEDGQVLLILRDITGDRQVEAIRREFVANASHELKTPVASIRALAETIAASSAQDPGVTGRFVAQLEQEAVRLSRIVSDLLDLSRLEARTGERVRVRFDHIVAEEVGRLEGAAKEEGLSLTLSAGNPVEVLGSAADLALLVRNLVENATQYTRPGGSIDVTLSVEDHHAMLTVRDTGVGIPGRDRSRIFERFYRVDRARSRETGGTGLGLSIVKHVAENHGGSVGVESELGAGSTFVVRIPLAGDLQEVP